MGAWVTDESPGAVAKYTLPLLVLQGPQEPARVSCFQQKNQTGAELWATWRRLSSIWRYQASPLEGHRNQNGKGCSVAKEEHNLAARKDFCCFNCSAGTKSRTLSIQGKSWAPEFHPLSRHECEASIAPATLSWTRLFTWISPNRVSVPEDKNDLRRPTRGKEPPPLALFFLAARGTLQPAGGRSQCFGRNRIDPVVSYPWEREEEEERERKGGKGGRKETATSIPIFSISFQIKSFISRTLVKFRKTSETGVFDEL